MFNSNTNPYNKTSIISLQDISYEDALALIEFLEKLTNSDGELYKAHYEKMKVKWKRNEEENERRKQRERQLFPMIEKWVFEGNLKPDTYVKMKGCRDGKGIRKVLSVKSPFGNRTSIIECRQVNAWDKFGNEILGQVTEHMSDKIIQVRIDGIWTPIREVVQYGKISGSDFQDSFKKAHGIS